MSRRLTTKRVTRLLVFPAALTPLAWLMVRGLDGGLGANPIETVTHETGIWALRFLVITLAVSPLRRLSGWSAIIGLRRMLGLFAFFYAALHFGTYVVLDQFFDLDAIVADVVDRPYITVGFSAFVLLIPLALTSTRKTIRRLGGKRWRWLHRLIYPCAILAATHYLWLVKADIRSPVAYGSVLAVLLGFRAWHALAARTRRMLPADASSRQTSTRWLARARNGGRIPGEYEQERRKLPLHGAARGGFWIPRADRRKVEGRHRDDRGEPHDQSNGS